MELGVRLAYPIHFLRGRGFFLFLLLAVLCEYVGRILEETQDRPLYFVSHEKSSSVLLESSVEKNIVHEAMSSLSVS